MVGSSVETEPNSINLHRHGHDPAARTQREQEWAGLFLSGPLTWTETLTKWLAKLSFLAAADGGLDHLFRKKILPQLVVGDMDSVASASLAWAEAASVVREVYPTEKNQTDGELLITRVMAEGYTNLLLAGSLGGNRLDHMLGIMHYALALRKRFALNLILTDGERFVIPLSGKVEQTFELADFLPQSQIERIRVSLIPITDVANLTYRGLRYPLENQFIEAGSTRCVSNEVLAAGTFTLSMDAGEALLVINEEK
ncbi:MAG: thiamine diphosphokinase [Clostridia bacterium]|nr:thiamine diphosphokinase [Clostridia bacterium]